MSTHVLLSPSSRHRWGKCARSVTEEAKFPEVPAGPAATDGTHSHTLLEKCIQENIKDANIFVGTELTDHEGSFTVDRERAMRVNLALAYIWQRQVDLAALFVIAEQRVDPAWFVGPLELSGTVDCQMMGKGVLEIIDYKDGMHPVPAQDNPQLEQYAIGKLAEFKLALDASEYPVHTVRMTIIQPKAMLKGAEAVSYWEVPVQQMLDQVKVLMAQADAAQDPNAAFTPGESQCRYCRAKGSCKASADHALEKVGMMMPALSTPVLADLSNQAAAQDPHMMSDEQLVSIMEAAPLVRQLIEAVEAEAQARLEAGKTVNGLKLVNGRGSRNWNVSEEDMAAKLKKMGVPKEAIHVTKLVSPAQAEKLSWKKRDGSTASLSTRQIATLKSEYVCTTVGKPSVALASDPRSAVMVSAQHLFSPVVDNVPPVTVNEPVTSDALPLWLS